MGEPNIRVRVLGGLSFETDDGPLPPISSRAASVLLAYLILNRDRAVTRDLLAGRFWSDQADDKARRRLNDALWQIRAAGRKVGLDLLESTSSSVRFAADIRVDVDVERFTERLDELERRIQADRRPVRLHELAQVVDLYTGDLLAGYYEEWIGGPREAARDRYLASVKQLVRLTSADNDFDRALRYAKGLATAEPLAEEWHREVMRLSALGGQPSAAERQFEECRKIFEQELGVEPSAETVELLERIRAEAATQSVEAAAGAPPPLIGRAAERSLLVGRLSDLLAGRGGAVLVEGEPGIGKTRLVEAMADAARWRDLQVLIGHHAETSELVPYEGLIEALGPVATGLRAERLSDVLPAAYVSQAAQVLPGLAALVRERAIRQNLQPEQETWRTAEALARVVLAQAEPRPTLVVLEDVHYADADSLRVLNHLADRLVDVPVMVCLTYHRLEAQRRTDVWETLGRIDAGPGSSRLVVPALSEGEVRDLVRAEIGSGRLPEELLGRLASSTGGNPYIITELLRSPGELFDIDVFADGVEPGEVGRESAATQLPERLPRLTELLLQRVEAAPPATRAVLEVVAVLDGVAPVEIVAAAVEDLGRPDVVTALTDAVERGLLVETERGCQFAQHHTRQVVYDDVEPDRRSRLHGRLLDAFVGTGALGVEQMAHHAWRAEQWHRAYQYHSLAAESAFEKNAFGISAEHFGMADEAARLAGIGDRDRIEDLLEMERVLNVLGQREDQQDVLNRLSDLDDLPPAVEVEHRARRAWMLALTDEGREAIRLADETIELARGTGVGTAELFILVGTVRAWLGDLAGAIGPLEEAVAELEAAGAPTARARLTLGRTELQLGHHDRALDQVERAYQSAKEDNDAQSMVDAVGARALIHTIQRHDLQAEADYGEALDLARRIGYRYGEGVNLVNLATLHTDLGRGGRAYALYREAGAVFASLGNGRGEAFVKLNASELAHRILGDDQTARAEAEEAAVYFRKIGAEQDEAACLTMLASIERRAGRRRLARRQLLEAVAKAEASGDQRRLARGLLELGIVALDLGLLDEAGDGVDRALAVCRTPDLRTFVPALLATDARLEVAKGRAATGAEVAQRIVRMNKVGVEYGHLVAWWCAQVLIAAGEERAAADQIALAHELLGRTLDGLPPELVRGAWTEVPEHRAIAEAHERFFVDRVDVSLPRIDAPTGRALRPEDFVDVSWTTSDPDDWTATSSAERRRRRIVRLAEQAVAQGAAARVVDLAEALGVSDRTIKRDLKQLRQDGVTTITLRAAND
ncbi:MAG: AAA family ATPase [Acidimicrobiales bacterium]